MPPAADVPPRPPSSRGASRNAAPAATPRRQPAPAKAKAGPARRLVRPALALITLVLVADALVGENGWFERRREQERLQQKAAELARLHQQNAELSLRAKRLEAADPAVVEDLARRKLEMMKPGEVLFIDGTPAAPADAPTPLDAVPASSRPVRAGPRTHERDDPTAVPSNRRVVSCRSRPALPRFRGRERDVERRRHARADADEADVGLVAALADFQAVDARRERDDQPLRRPSAPTARRRSRPRRHRAGRGSRACPTARAPRPAGRDARSAAATSGGSITVDVDARESPGTPGSDIGPDRRAVPTPAAASPAGRSASAPGAGGFAVGTGRCGGGSPAPSGSISCWTLKVCPTVNSILRVSGRCPSRNSVTSCSPGSSRSRWLKPSKSSTTPAK